MKVFYLEDIYICNCFAKYCCLIQQQHHYHLIFCLLFDRTEISPQLFFFVSYEQILHLLAIK